MTDFRPIGFRILPSAVKNLVIVNVLVFLIQHFVFSNEQQQINTLNLFALHTFQSPLFRPWQFVTHMFMHADIGHIFFNMFALWTFGSVLEGVWGPKRFLLFYFICGFGAAILHSTALYFHTESLIHLYNATPTDDLAKQVGYLFGEPTLGASGAVFGCLAAFGYLFPNTELYLMFLPIPIKAKWAVLCYAGIELALAVRNSSGDNVAHLAHLGGALAGFLMVYFWNKTNRKTFY